jgi:hypothetical protein
MRQLVSGSFLAAVAMFIFGAVYWTMPLPYSGVQPVGEDAVAAALLSQIFPDTGLYMLPDPDMASADPEAYARMHREGPVVMANVVHGAGEPMQASAFVVGFLHQFASCFLIGLLLVMVAPALQTLGRRATFAALMGFTAAFFIDMGAVVWWRMPLSFQLYSLLYDTVAWAIAGLVLARFVGPREPLTA